MNSSVLSISPVLARTAITLVLLSLAIAPGTAADAPPNVVLIFADDLGYGDVGYQGGGVPTPHIDSIASGGVVFTDGYVTCAVCAPSRAGMLTGRYQQSFGFWDNIGPFRRNKDVEPGIPVDLPILSERLQELGYTTGLFGKTHDGDAEATRDRIGAVRREAARALGWIEPPARDCSRTW